MEWNLTNALIAKQIYYIFLDAQCVSWWFFSRTVNFWRQKKMGWVGEEIYLIYYIISR